MSGILEQVDDRQLLLFRGPPVVFKMLELSFLTLYSRTKMHSQVGRTKTRLKTVGLSFKDDVEELHPPWTKICLFSSP